MRYFGTLGLVGLLACDTSSSDGEMNRAPRIDTLVVLPNDVITTSTKLRCVANVSDPNEDLVSVYYLWTNAQGVELSETSVLELNAELVSPNEVVTCTATAADGVESVTDSIEVTVGNMAPEIEMVRITPTAPGLDDLLTCSFEASDADGEEPSVSYSWTQNGAEVGTDETLQLSSEAFESYDEIACIVTVEDSFGGVNSASTQVVIDNTAPTIGSVSITPESAYSTDTLTCMASEVFDEQGHDVELSYQWSIGLQVQSETSDTLVGPFPVDSDILCRVTPNDGYIDGRTVGSSVTILNTAPVMTDVSIVPNTGVEADALLECISNGSDIDNEGLTTTYSWTDLNGNILGADNTLQLYPSVFSPGDTVNCQAIVEDVHGASASLSTSVLVENTLPSVSSSAQISGLSGSGDTLTCSGSFTDLNDGTLTPVYSWTKSDGTVLSTTDTYTIDIVNTDVGDQLTCTVSASDSEGESISTSTSVTVENAVPVIGSVELSPSSLASTDDVSCLVGGIDDIDGDTVSINYTWTIGGVVQSETSDTLSAPFVAGSVIGCSVTPNDGFADGETLGVTVQVDNTAPTVSSVNLDAGMVLSDGVVTAEAVLSDVDLNQNVTANYEWFVNGMSVQTGTLATLEGSFFVKGDEVYVVVTPNDGVVDGDSMTSVSTVIENTAPSNVSVTVTSSNNFYNDSVLTCSATADDLDVSDNVDSLSFDYTWSTGDTGSTLDLDGQVNPADTVTCSVSVTDGTDSASGSNTQLIANRLPSIVNVILPQNVTREIPSITCISGGVDPDGETVTLSYEWMIDGVIQSETSNVLTDSFMFESVVKCTVTPSDALGNGVPMSTITTIKNTAPVIDLITLDAGTLSEDSTIEATVVASDVDPGQQITLNYEWFVNDVSVQNGADNSLSNAFGREDSIYVVVTPNDGIFDGNSLQSDTITITNTEPVMSNVSLSPNAPYGDGSITATATATDLNGDSITYTYAWFVNDISVQTGANNSLSGSLHFDKGDSVYVVVTPNDGTVSGSPLQSSAVTVINAPPTISSVSVSPIDPVGGQDDITCSVVANDLDGENLLYSFVWTDASGTVIQEVPNVSNTTNTIVGSETTAGIWTCAVTVSDGTETTSDTGTVTVVALESCEALLLQNPGLPSGTYNIAPDGSTVVEVYCDMEADGGGYDSYLVTNGLQTNAYTDANSCPSGMDIVVPRTQTHWDSLIATHGINSFEFIPGIYGTVPGNYTGDAMNSENVSNWFAVDGGDWWLRNTPHSEPSGDYTAGCWLSVTSLTNTSDLTFNDGDCGAGGTTYICSSNAKTAPQTCLDLLELDPTLPSGTYTIYPNGSKPVDAYCDMETDGGGYDSYLVTGGAHTSRNTDFNSCPWGMDIVVPRTQAHWDSLIATHGASNFHFVPGIFGSVPGDYTSDVMNSDSVSNWHAIDNGTWWLRDTPHSEPSGDYEAGCWMGSLDLADTSNITFNDDNCNYGSSTYICSTNTK